MTKHSHRFVEDYDGPVGFGLDRETDESTVRYFLQKLSDDQLSGVLAKRMTDAELEELFDTVSRLTRAHLSEDEYHALFLKE